MRKVLFSVVIVATLSLSVYTYTQRQQSTEVNPLALENVEALAQGEWGGGVYCQWDNSLSKCTRFASGPVCLLSFGDCTMW